MNTLIVYDSHYGNTERLAQTIADTLRGFGQVRTIRVNVPQAISLGGVELLILGSPTQGFRPTPAMQSLLENIAPQVPHGLTVACFDTRFRGFFWKRSAAPHMAGQLHALGVGSRHFSPPKSPLRIDVPNSCSSFPHEAS
jgi:flavodoxin